MNFKKHWNKENGLTAVYTGENSVCRQMEVSMLRLPAGETHLFAAAPESEYACVILGGRCRVSGGVDFGEIGKRKNVFDGKAYAFYIPRKTAFRLEAVTELEVAIVICPCFADYAPRLITPDGVIVKHLGKPGFEREAHFLLDERIEAGRVYVGENFIEGGQWSSYPGHKHDVEHMPSEGFAEEIYYYEYDKPTGFGIQRVYTDDKKTDEVYATYNGDFVEMPYGYHPCTVAPGYRGYLLWMMSCDHRGFYMSTDPDHAWLVK